MYFQPQRWSESALNATTQPFPVPPLTLKPNPKRLTGSKTAGISSGNYLRGGYGSATDGQYTNYSTPTINSTGEDGTGKNMPPYLAVNVWKRTA